MEGRKQPTYSEAPVALIDITSLPATRFVETKARKYPFRDAAGRVNIHLVNSSLKEAKMDGADVTTLENLAKWQRHALRALHERPDDERRTLDSLANDKSLVDTDCSLEREPPKTVAWRRRLFRAPRPEDEPYYDLEGDSSPTEDRLYLSRLAEEGSAAPLRKRKRAERKRAKRVHTRRASAVEPEEHSSESDLDIDDDEDDEKEEGLYEVDEILEEDEQGSRGFLLSWAGYSSEHNTWEPEWNVAPHLVAAFRRARDLTRSHQGDDYTLGRKRNLWCATCGRHFAADSFSAHQRRVAPAQRVCLIHHYRTEAPQALRKPNSTGTPDAGVSSTPARTATYKRARTASLSLASLTEPPPPPIKPARPIARALSHRQAAMEVRTARLFGFGAR